MRKGWVTSKLVNIGEIQTGTTPSTKKQEYYGDYIPFVKPPHFNADGSIAYSDIGLSEIGLQKGRLIKENSILMVCIGATIGKTGLSTIPVSCNQQINAFTPNINLFPKYFYYLMSSKQFFNKVITNSSQATLPMINKTKWQNLEVTYPKSLKEQKQIVAILDEAFEAIDQAQANIKKNIENSKELFQSKLNDIFSQKGEGWEEKSLGSMSKIMYGCTSKVVDNGNVQYVRITDIQGGEINWKTVPYIDLIEEEKVKYRLEKGDIVFARTGATTGKSYLMLNPPNAVFASYLIRVQCNLDILEPSFLYLYFQSGLYWKLVGEGISGSAQGGFNATKLKDMQVHFPSNKSEQLNYVTQINKFQKHIKKIENSYQQKLINLEDLKKSLLEQAFAGELTHKDMSA